MRRGPNPKIFLLMAVGAFVVGGLLAFSAFNNLESAKGHLRKVQAASRDARTLNKELGESEASLKDSLAKLQHLEQGVQDYAYVPTMLSDLDTLGKASGIDVTGVRPLPKPVVAKQSGPPPSDEEKPKKKAYDELDIEVKGRGNYHSVLTFIEALDKFPKIVAARTVEMNPKMDPGQTLSTLDVTIGLRAYIFAGPPASQKGTRTAMASGSTHEG